MDDHQQPGSPESITGKNGPSRIFVVLNPVAGHSSAGEIKAMVEKSLNTTEMVSEIYETTGEEDVSEIARTAVSRGSEIVIAAGGDGTVAAVINGLQNTNVPMGIIPVGTGNILARTLGIPMDAGQAIELFTGENRTICLDALKVGDRCFMLNVSAGISARTIDGTTVERKRRFGMLAYLWTFTHQLIGLQPRRFWLTVDDHRLLVRASEIFISNGTPTKEPLLLGPVELYNDGIMDVYIVTAQALWDYIKIAWNVLIRRTRQKTDLRRLTAKQKVKIEAVRGALPTQADGETLGYTPVEVELIPSAFKVIIPLADSDKTKPQGE